MKKIALSVTACMLIMHAFSQYQFFEPKGSFAIEVSLENTKMKRLPIHRNSISSLAVVGDMIIGGTKAEQGLSPFVFVASISGRELSTYVDLETVVAGQRSIATGFCKSGTRALYAGTIADEQNGQQQGGHIILVNVGNAGIDKITDLGVPVPGEGIHALALDDKAGVLYGISYPTGVFFTFDIKSKKVSTYNDLVPKGAKLNKLVNEFGLKPDDYVCKALAIDRSGQVYGSAPINQLFYFDPKTKKINYLKDSLPEVWGRNVLGQVESWTISKDGKLYGGNAGDGQLFIIDPATKRVKNLGKPAMVNRLRGLTFAADGNLYGIAGALPGYSHLFRYNAQEGFKDYGNPQFRMVAPGIEQGIDWRGFQLGSITASPDGKYVVIGEDESLSHLLVFPTSN